jgi:hypothetical protein
LQLDGDIDERPEDLGVREFAPDEGQREEKGGQQDGDDDHDATEPWPVLFRGREISRAALADDRRVLDLLRTKRSVNHRRM